MVVPAMAAVEVEALVAPLEALLRRLSVPGERLGSQE